jgi:hypothetical protein
LLKSVKPDVIISWLWFWDFKAIIPEIIADISRTTLPGVKLMVFTDDVHSKREQQIAEQYKSDQLYNHYKRRSVKMRHIEVKVYRQADIVVTITRTDRMDVLTLEPAMIDKVKYMNFVFSPWDQPEMQVDRETGIMKVRPWAKRKNVVFVGNGKNPTNIHALNWFVSEIVDELNKGIPGFLLHVIGPGWDVYKVKCIETNPARCEHLVFEV